MRDDARTGRRHAVLVGMQIDSFFTVRFLRSLRIL